jgi:RNA polymerase sigma factor (sigma-70 family)
MVKGSGVNTVVRYLQTFFEEGTVAGLSDGQLLGRFVERREEAALEALVRRHGPMVWGVCRRVLQDHHDAEDAFQATFFVLARRAASILPREKVGNWLYGVAYQTARKARATRAKRRLREAQVPDAPEPEAASNVRRNELAEFLDHELSRLPDKYRTPLVLCELEGQTHGEAAERLGWPIGTVSGRLSRARALLAKRLSRRGVSFSAGSLAVLLAPHPSTAAASVPASLLAATLKAATSFPAGAVSAEVAALTREVLKTMLVSKIKFTTAALVALTFVGAILWQATTWASLVDGSGPAVNGAAANETFRVTVNEVIHDDSTVVTQVEIDAARGATIEMFTDQDKREGAGTHMALGPSDTSGPARIKLTIFADQVEWKAGSTNLAKFMLHWKLGKISSSTSETDPMPAGKQLADLLTVPIKSGQYPCGKVTKLLTFKGKTYSLVVNKPK